MNIIVGICACLVLGGAVVSRRLGVYMCECAGVCEFLGDVCVSACMCVCIRVQSLRWSCCIASDVQSRVAFTRFPELSCGCYHCAESTSICAKGRWIL